MATNLSVHTRNRLISALTSQRAASEIQNILEVVNPAVGDVWYVDSVTGNSANSGKTSGAAVATIDQAVALCTANKGDVVYVLPGHVEDLGAAASIDLDVAGILVIGLGSGPARPRIDFNATDAIFNISANGITVRNMTFRPSVALVVTGI